MQWPLVLCSLCLLWAVEAKIHNLVISNDNRRVFGIEYFGFSEGGAMDLVVTNLNFNPTPSAKSEMPAGFILQKVESIAQGETIVADSNESGACLWDTVDSTTNAPFALDLSDPTQLVFNHQVLAGQAGLYHLVYSSCLDADTTVSFDLRVDFYNPGPDYLGVGLAPLPYMLYTLAVLYFIGNAAWIFQICRNSQFYHRIHLFMALLGVNEFLSILFEGVSLTYVKLLGVEIGWSVMYYIFAFITGVGFFLVVVLLGVGFNVLKPILNPRDKKIILSVLILQVIGNIAFIIVDESAPGSKSWNNLLNLFNLIDIVCCCIIMFPIVQSIKFLRQAAATDGKMERNLELMLTFRQFYLYVVCYIYFTRIIVVIAEESMPYYLRWTGVTASEFSTFLFYAYTAYKFRPKDQSYLRVNTDSDDENDEEEYGLGEGESRVRQNHVDRSVEMT